ncbi:unnamed protein product, partial [Closterium sp. NIES-53]
PSAAAATATAATTAANAATAATATAATTAATAATTAPACCNTMASLRVLAFDHEGRPIQFDTWLDDLQLYLLSDSKDSVTLFHLASGAATVPPATADSATHSQWLTRDAAARLAIHNHLPLAECDHFGQHRTAQALYDVVVARYSMPANAALDRLLLPYLFPKLSAFATVKDLVSHLRTSNTCYRATVPAEDHFLSLDPTSLTVDLLEQHLLAAETSAVAVGVARGTPSPPFFEGCSPSPLAPFMPLLLLRTSLLLMTSGLLLLVRSDAAARARVAEVVEGAAAVVELAAGVVVGAAVEVVEAVEVVAGVGALVVAVEAAVGVAVVAAVGLVAVGLEVGVEALEVASGSSSSVGARPNRPSSFTCRRFDTQHRCFSYLDDAWSAKFGDKVERPRSTRSGVAIFDLDFDAILSAMYALSVSAEGDRYQCVPPNPSIAAAALGASELSTLPGTALAEALHTFMLDSGASRCFFRDCTTLTPLPAPVPVRLADPSGGPVVANSSTVLPCLAVPSGSLSGLRIPSFSTNLVSTAALQDSMVTTTTPGGQRVSICMCTRTGCHLATFTRRPGSSLYTLATEPPQVVASAQVSASSQVAASCSCHLLSHQTLLWHHRLGHPSLPRLCGMQSCLLRAAPHSSFPPTTAPLQTLRMDVWGPACISRQGRERYFLLVVDDYTRYTTVFPLRSKGQVVDVLIPWIRAVRLQLRERFRQDLPVLRLHSDRGGDFSSYLLRDICRGEGILQSFTLLDSPQQNEIAQRRIGLVMEVARTSMIHAAAPHFLWPLAVRYAAHQLNLWPRVSLPETSPTLRWTGKVGDASVFRAWGSRAFVRDTSADKLSPRAMPCVFLDFVHDTPGWQFYHPTLRRVFPSQDIMFDESVPFYRLFPYHSAPPPPPPLFLVPGPPPVDPLPPQGPAPSGVSQVDPLPGTAPVEVAVGSGAARGAVSGGAEPVGAESEGAGSGGAEPEGEEPGGAERAGVEPGGVEPGGAESEGAESGGVEPQGAASSGGPASASPRQSLHQLCEWLVRRARLRSTTAAGPGGARTRGAGAGETGGVGGAGVGDSTEPRVAGAGGSCAGGAGAGAGGAGAGGAGAGGARVGGTGVGGTGAAGAGAVDPGAGGAGGTVRPRPYSKPPLLSASPLPAPFPYTEQSGGLTECREPASRPVSPVRIARHVPRLCPPPVPGTHVMALCPSSVPLRVPLPAPPESSFPEVPDPESERARAASPTVSRFLATAVTDPSFASAAASALVAELLDFAAACHLDYATALVAESAESESTSLPSVGVECALDTDVLEDRQEDFECLAAAVPRFASMLLALEGDPDAPDIPTPRSYAEAITGPYSSQWQAAMDAEMASWKSTGTYVDEVPPPGANIVDGMWIFRVKRLSGSPPAFKARYVARGFSQRQGVDYFQTFSPILKMTTLWSARGDLAAPPTWLHWVVSCRYPVEPPPASLVLRQAPCELHDTLGTMLAALGFAPSIAYPSLFLRTDTSLPSFYVRVYVDDLVFATGDTEALTLVKSELQKRHTCTDLGELRSYLGLQITRDRA